MKHRLNDMIFVHYGRNELSIEGFYKPPQIPDDTKPEYGLWGCPVSPLYFRLVDIPVVKAGLWMWVHNPCLCLASLSIHKYGFLNRGNIKFRLTKNADILVIEHEKDIEPYCKVSDFKKALIDMGYTNKEKYKITRDKFGAVIDFDLIKEAGYDGMFVFHNKNELDDTILYRWETDSLVVWNPDVIRIIK